MHLKLVHASCLTTSLILFVCARLSFWVFIWEVASLHLAFLSICERIYPRMCAQIYIWAHQFCTVLWHSCVFDHVWRVGFSSGERELRSGCILYLHCFARLCWFLQTSDSYFSYSSVSVCRGRVLGRRKKDQCKTQLGKEFSDRNW